MIDSLQQRVGALEAGMAGLEVIKNRQGWLMIIGIVSLAVHIAFKAAERQHAAPGNVTAGAQSVTVGAVPKEAPPRDWVTTSEFAEREGVSPRTVQSWIAAGEVPAARDPEGRAYRIPADFRRLSAADSGN